MTVLAADRRLGVCALSRFILRAAPSRGGESSDRTGLMNLGVINVINLLNATIYREDFIHLNSPHPCCLFSVFWLWIIGWINVFCCEIRFLFTFFFKYHWLKSISAICSSDNFQDQMKRELSYREEMVQQLHIVRGETNKAEERRQQQLSHIHTFTYHCGSFCRHDGWQPELKTFSVYRISRTCLGCLAGSDHLLFCKAGC